MTTATATRKSRKGFPKTHANGVAFTEKRPGVVATILGCLQKASKDKPTTKVKILEVLVKSFPDRDPEKMKATVSGMVTWIRVEHKLTVKSNDHGYWI